MNKSYKITLRELEKEILEGIISKGSYVAAKLKRAYVLMVADEREEDDIGTNLLGMVKKIFPNT